VAPSLVYGTVGRFVLMQIKRLSNNWMKKIGTFPGIQICVICQPRLMKSDLDDNVNLFYLLKWGICNVLETSRYLIPN